MSRNFTQRKRIHSLLRTGLLLAIVLYFGFHLVSGNKGVLTLLKLEAQLNTLQKEAEEVAKQRAVISKKVQAMYDSSLDVEVLDEQVRRNLGYIPKAEKVYYPQS